LAAMSGKGALGGLAAVAVAIGVLALAPAASAFIYWGDTQNDTIGRAANDGSHVDDAFIHTGQGPFQVAVDSTHVYWVNAEGNSIGRANIDGSGVNNSFIPEVKEPSGVAVNGSSIYWSTVAGLIGRANIDGSAPNYKFITSASVPCGLGLDSGHVYWDSDTLPPEHIGRASLDGLFLQPEYVTIETGFPCGVAVNSANIYWADTGFFGKGGTRIGRADVATGKSVDLSFISGASAPCGIALDGASHLYWANSETNTIARANTDGTGVDQSFIATGANQPCGVAVDSLTPPPPPGSGDTTPPQTKIVKGPGGKLGRGIAKFGFRANEAGSHFLCRLDRGKARACKSPRTFRGLKPGRHLFSVAAVDAAGNEDATPAKRRFKVPA
jgi:streptogramin lyase